jgi:Family of unknown function (DUF6221)
VESSEPGAVSADEGPVTWLRQRIRERLHLARHAIELGNAAEWIEQSSGVLLFAGPTETDAWNGTWASGDSSVTRLMEANDPQDTIARCEAELAILGEHYILTDGDRNPAYEAFSLYPCGPKGGARDRGSGCVTCHYYSQGAVKSYGICRTVRLLASGYRYRPGYREEDWGP